MRKNNLLFNESKLVIVWSAVRTRNRSANRDDVLKLQSFHFRSSIFDSEYSKTSGKHRKLMAWNLDTMQELFHSFCYFKTKYPSWDTCYLEYLFDFPMALYKYFLDYINLRDLVYGSFMLRSRLSCISTEF